MRSLTAILIAIFTIAAPLRATDFPTVKTVLPDVSAAPGNSVPSIDLRDYFEVADIHGQVVQIRTTSGNFNLEMLPTAAPLSVANFVNSYVNTGRYAGTLVHRSDKSLGVIQGGGYFSPPSSPAATRIANDAPIALEYNLPNTRGTIAMARTSVLNSATSEWFVNTKDNTVNLGQANGGGYAVFGRVTGTGMTVVDAVAALTVYNATNVYGGACGQLPLKDYTGPALPVAANFVTVNAAEAIPIFPAAEGQNAVVAFSVTNTNTALVTATVSGSALSMALVPGAIGIADITVTATDTNGNALQDTFRVNVVEIPAEISVEQPAGNDVADGGTRAFPLLNVGGSSDLTFTIKNAGTQNLSLTGTPKVAVDGADAAMFSVTEQPASPVVGPNGSTTFTVRFAPTSGGAKTAALHVESDDADENPFDINLTGTANALPVLTLPASPVIVEPVSLNGSVVTFSVTANDAEDGSLTPVVTPASGSTFPLGDTTVNVSATDTNGAQVTGSFIVRVSFARPGSTTVIIGAGSGEPAPGAGTGALPAGTVLSGFGQPAVSDFRMLTARVTMLAGRTTLGGIYVEDGTGAKSLPAYQGGPAPGISTAGVTFKRFFDPLISPNGSIAFGAFLQGAATATGNDFGVWTNAFGSALELVLREGLQVPGLPVGSRLQSVASLSLRDGELLALITLRPVAGVTTLLNDTVLLRMTSAGAATVLLREGRELTGLPGSRIRSFSMLNPAAASAGHGRWHADGEVVSKITLYDGRVLIAKIAPNGTPTPMLFTGTAATAVSPLARWTGFGLPAVGSEGTGFSVAGALRIGSGGVTAGNDNALLFSTDGGTWSVFAREGASAPVTPSGPLYATFLDPLVSDGGKVAFMATLQGSGVTTANRVAIFGGPSSSPVQVARLGAHPPDEAGAATTAGWTRFLTCALPSGGGAGVVFLAETGGGDTTAANKTGLWAVDSQGTLRRLVRTGDSLTLGGSRIASLNLLGALPGSYGATRSYNALGSVALLATFTNGSQKILRVDIP